VLNGVQALQVLLTQVFSGTECARRIAELGALMPSGDARRAYAILMNTLLARRLAVGWQAEAAVLREALEDAWVHKVVQRRWEQLALRLQRADCERIVRLAATRGFGGFGGRALRWVDDAQAVDGWAVGATGAPPRSLPPPRFSRPLPRRSELEVVVDHDRRMV
jgi:hypothetical protein